MRLKDARIAAGLSTVEVANALGVSKAAVCQWEAGVYLPRVARLSELAKLYGCTVDELLKKEE